MTHESFGALVEAARAGRLAESRGAGDAAVDTFLDRFLARISPEDPVPTLLACAAEDDGPVGEAAAAWFATSPDAPPFVRRLTRAAQPGLVLAPPDGERADPIALAADAAGDRVVVVDHGRWPDGHDVLVFDVPARTCRRLKGDPRMWGNGVAVSPDGAWAVVVAGRKPHVVDLRDGTVTTLPKGHRTDVESAVISGPDTFYTGGKDGAVHHWHRSGKKLASAPKAHSSHVMGLALRGAELYTAGFDSRIRVWAAPPLAPLRDLPSTDAWSIVPLAGGDVVTRDGRLAPDGDVRYAIGGAIAVDEARGRLYVGTDEGIGVHDLATGERLGLRPGLRPHAMCVRAGRLFVVERYHAQLHVLPVDQLLGAPSSPEASAGAMVKASLLAASPDGSRLVVVRDGGGGRIEVERGGRLHHGSGLVLCDADGASVADLPGLQSPFAFAGDALVARTAEGAIEVRDLRDGAARWAVPGGWPTRMVRERLGRACAARWGEVVALVAAREPDREGIDLRDAATGELRASLGDWSQVRALFPEGGALWFSTADRVGRIDGDAITWEVPVADPRALRARGGDVFVAEGATIRHLRAADGAAQATMKGRFKKPLHCLALDDDGRVWSGGGDGRLRVWDPARGAEVGQAEADGKAIWHVRAGGGLVLAMSGYWAHTVFDAKTLATVAEPWGTLTEADLDTVPELFPEGAYDAALRVLHLRSGRSARWVADRSNLTVTTSGGRIWIAPRTATGPVEVLEWVAPPTTIAATTSPAGGVAR